METDRNRERSWLSRAARLAPWGILGLASLGMAVPATRSATRRLIEGELHPVELVTFATLFVAGLLGLALVSRTWRRGEHGAAGFFGVFVAGMLVVAFDEISWGQHFFGFEPPEAWKEVNDQDELTLHNLWFMQGHSEFLRLAFGLGGLVGALLWRAPRLRGVAVPPTLLQWFLAITAVSALDLYLDYGTLGWAIDQGVDRLSEVTEMMVGMAGLLYVCFHLFRKRREPPPA